MMRTMKLAVLAAAMLTARAGQTQASQTFHFSISSNPSVANVPGTVTGEIVLPFNGDGSGAASQILVETYPAGLNIAGPAPLDVTSYAYQYHNSFTVTGGLLTAADYESSNDGIMYVSGDVEFGILVDAGTTSGLESLAPPNTDLFTGNYDGVAGVTFTPEAAPEPATITMLVSGFLAAGGFGLRRRRKAV